MPNKVIAKLRVNPFEAGGRGQAESLDRGLRAANRARLTENAARLERGWTERQTSCIELGAVGSRNANYCKVCSSMPPSVFVSTGYSARNPSSSPTVGSSNWPVPTRTLLGPAWNHPAPPDPRCSRGLRPP